MTIKHSLAAALLVMASQVQGDFWIWSGNFHGAACGVGAAGCFNGVNVAYMGMTAPDDGSCDSLGTFVTGNQQGAEGGVAYCPALPEGIASFSFVATNCGFNQLFYAQSYQAIDDNGALQIALDDTFADPIATCTNTGGQIEGGVACNEYADSYCVRGSDGTGTSQSAYWWCTDFGEHTSCT